jgi:hypothetical protein
VDEGLEAEVGCSWPDGFACPSDGRATAWGHAVSDEETAAARREKPLDERSPWTRLQDEISLRAGVRRKTVERLRAPEDGTERGAGRPRDW